MPELKFIINHKFFINKNLAVFVGMIFIVLAQEVYSQSNSDLSLNSIIISVNGERKAIEANSKLDIVRGDLLILIEGDYKNGERLASEKIDAIDLLGFAPKRPKASFKDDRGFVIDTAVDLQSKFSKDGKGDEYQVDGYLKKKLLGSIYFTLTEPKLMRVDLSINGKVSSLQDGGLLELRKTDTIAVTKITTNVRGNENIRHEFGSKPSKEGLRELTFYRGNIKIGSVSIKLID